MTCFSRICFLKGEVKGRNLMKKVATLILAAGMVLCFATGANAIDFKAKGQWIMSFDYGQNAGFTGGSGIRGFGKSNEDEFEAKQRIRLQLDAVASDNLSGTLYFEIGRQFWGRAEQGGALGADGKQVKVKNAYIDWMIPNSDAKVRMGIQGLSLPSFTTGSQIFRDDVAAVVANYNLNDNIGLTAFWARPYNDNFTGDTDRYSGDGRKFYMDNMDMFGFLMPMSFEGIKVTPWGIYTAIGPNTFRKADNYIGNTGSSIGVSNAYSSSGLFAADGARHRDGSKTTVADMGSYGDAWWFGLTGQISLLDPLRISWDFNYGSTSYDERRLNRQGWLSSLLFEYKMDWAVPGLYGWYSSGDDSNPANGSERMPYISTSNTNNGFSSFAFNGAPYDHTREGILGYSMAGTWGIGARLKDMSFVDDLKHILRVNLMGGTNAPAMARKMMSSAWGLKDKNKSPTYNGIGLDPLYMTTKDTALELGLANSYKMYENFIVYLEGSYIATWLDGSSKRWGSSKLNGKSDNVCDPWNINLSFVYAF